MNRTRMNQVIRDGVYSLSDEGHISRTTVDSALLKAGSERSEFLSLALSQALNEHSSIMITDKETERSAVYEFNDNDEWTVFYVSGNKIQYCKYCGLESLSDGTCDCELTEPKVVDMGDIVFSCAIALYYPRVYDISVRK